LIWPPVPTSVSCSRLWRDIFSVRDN
jgi:hypothetical protein